MDKFTTLPSLSLNHLSIEQKKEVLTLISLTKNKIQSIMQESDQSLELANPKNIFEILLSKMKPTTITYNNTQQGLAIWANTSKLALNIPASNIFVNCMTEFNILYSNWNRDFQMYRTCSIFLMALKEMGVPINFNLSPILELQSQLDPIEENNNIYKMFKYNISKIQGDN